MLSSSGTPVTGTDRPDAGWATLPGWTWRDGWDQAQNQKKKPYFAVTLLYRETHATTSTTDTPLVKRSEQDSDVRCASTEPHLTAGLPQLKNANVAQIARRR